MVDLVESVRLGRVWRLDHARGVHSQAHAPTIIIMGKRPRSFASCGGASSPIGAGPALAVGAVLTWHIHLHRHDAGRARIGTNMRRSGTDVAVGFERDPPLHELSHQSRRGTRLVMIVGSAPIVEDIPAFVAAGE